MKYPRLPAEDNLSRKLTDEQIEEIQKKYSRVTKKMTSTAAMNTLAQQYGVSYATIYYWVKEKYRKWKRKRNVDYWNEMKTKDYEKWYKHKKAEINRRKNRMIRNPKLKLWHETVSAKNEKRCKRKTIHGKKIPRS